MRKKKIIKNIERFELRLRSDFKQLLFKDKGNINKITKDLDNFLTIKGLKDERKPKKRKGLF